MCNPVRVNIGNVSNGNYSNSQVNTDSKKDPIPINTGNSRTGSASRNNSSNKRNAQNGHGGIGKFNRNLKMFNKNNAITLLSTLYDKSSIMC